MLNPFESSAQVMRAWSTPRAGGPLSCKYTDLCAEVFPGAPMADGRPGITTQFPFDNPHPEKTSDTMLHQRMVRSRRNFVSSSLTLKTPKSRSRERVSLYEDALMK